jgi:hypothetical protein
MPHLRLSMQNAVAELTLDNPPQNRIDVFDIAIPLFECSDVGKALPWGVQALLTGAPRPRFDFRGD